LINTRNEQGHLVSSYTAAQFEQGNVRIAEQTLVGRHDFFDCNVVTWALGQSLLKRDVHLIRAISRFRCGLVAPHTAISVAQSRNTMPRRQDDILCDQGTRASAASAAGKHCQTNYTTSNIVARTVSDLSKFLGRS
jgi:hypothetical protein